MMSRAIARDKQEREALSCPRCGEALEAIPLETNEAGFQKMWWMCKGTINKVCLFPMDMPPDVFVVWKSPDQILDGITPRPRLDLLPEMYRHMYPFAFPTSQPPTPMASRCSSSISRDNSSSNSTYSRDMSLPSPISSVSNMRGGSMAPSVFSSNSIISDAVSGTASPASASRDNDIDSVSSQSHNGERLSLKRVACHSPLSDGLYDKGAPFRRSLDRSSTGTADSDRGTIDSEDAGSTLTLNGEEKLNPRFRMSTLYSKLDSLDADQFNDSELAAFVDKIATDLKRIQKETVANDLLLKRVPRREYSPVSSTSFAQLDRNTLGGTVGSKSSMEQMQMMRDIRLAKDGKEVLAVLGLKAPRNTDRVEDILFVDVDERVRQALRGVQDRKRTRREAKKVFRESGKAGRRREVTKRLVETEKRRVEKEKDEASLRDIEEKADALIQRKLDALMKGGSDVTSASEYHDDLEAVSAAAPKTNDVFPGYEETCDNVVDPEIHTI